MVERSGVQLNMNDNIRLSKSAIVKFNRCNFDFYCDYILNFRKDRPDPPKGSPMAIGTEVHQIFEDYYSLPAAKDVEEPYNETILDLLMTLPSAKDHPVHMMNFAGFNEKMILRKGIENYFPKEVETQYYDEELNVIGIIDRVDECENGIMLTDYKTGKEKTIITKKRDGTLVDNHWFELAFYAILYERQTGKKVNEAGIYFSKTNKLRKMPITDTDREYAFSKIEEVREAISKKEYPTNSDYLCKWCQNSQVCEEQGDWW
jgi:CRISPR/Cas system-associated exonuclease Cas4 (RecB family)